MSKEFAAEYPALRPKDVTIRLMTRNPPTDEMAAITHVMPRGDKENRIAVEFELFGGADGQMNPNSGGSSVDAKKQVRPWWKFWN